MGLKITAGVQICKRAFIHFLVYLIYLLIYPFIYLFIYLCKTFVSKLGKLFQTS